MPVFSTGFRSPTTNGTPATYDGSATEFANAANAYSSNDSYATTVDNDFQYKWQSYGGFGINIDSNYIIKGIEVAVEGKTSTGNAYTGVFIKDSGGNWVDTVYAPFSTTEATYTYGNSSTLPSYGVWTPAGFSDANFYVLVYTGSANDGKTIYLDHIKVNVYYDTGPNTNETVTITENVNVNIFYSSDIDESDTITVSESITSVVELLSISVFENVWIESTVYDANDGITYDTGIVYDDIIITQDIENQSIRYGAGGRGKGSTERHGA